MYVCVYMHICVILKSISATANPGIKVQKHNTQYACTSCRALYINAVLVASSKACSCYMSNALIFTIFNCVTTQAANKSYASGVEYERMNQSAKWFIWPPGFLGTALPFHSRLCMYHINLHML